MTCGSADCSVQAMVSPRAPHSIRRTTSLDVFWPDGRDGHRRITGRARDLLSGQTGSVPQVRKKAEVGVSLAPDKTISELVDKSETNDLRALVDQKAGGHLRIVIAEQLPDLVASGDPLYLLLDDLSGAALVSEWAWSQWDPSWINATPDHDAKRSGVAPRNRTNVCWGLQLGNSGLEPDSRRRLRTAHSTPLVRADDPAGWHDLPEAHGIHFRRARWIDVGIDHSGEVINVEAGFQDSGSRPQGDRMTIHEYLICATVNRHSGELTKLELQPRVLPHAECPGAVANARALIGLPLANLRQEVLARLRGPAGCTHLNDALRALADVPLLARELIST